MILTHSILELRRGPIISIFNITLLLTGSLLHLVAELSPLPLFVALIYFCVGWLILWFSRFGGKWGRFIYIRVFLSGFLSAGIAALYRSFLGDILGDASAFFEIVSGAASGLSIIEIAALTEGALSVVLWREIFDLMALIGFPRDQYVGVLVNIFLVALSSVVAMIIVQQIYGYDPYRFNKLVLMYSFCGLFWIFAGILIRDSIILLSVNIIVCAFVFFLREPGFNYRLFLLIVVSILASIFFGFMRREFVFVPVAMLIAALPAMFFGQSNVIRKGNIILLFSFCFVILGVAYVAIGRDLVGALIKGRESYINQFVSINNNSLGMDLIVNQTILIRLVLGSVYLYIFPIPLWSGFQLDSSYHLFKSLNVFFIIFLLPLIILSLRMLWKSNLYRSFPIIFILFLVLGFTLAIAGTSLETRHIAVFYVPLFILALLPNTQNSIVKRNYREILFLVIGGFIFIHFAWIFLKFGFIILIKILLFIVLLELGMRANSKIFRNLFISSSLLIFSSIF